MHQGTGSGRTRVLFEGVFGSETFGQISSRNRPINVKRNDLESNVSRGHVDDGAKGSSDRHVGHLSRSLGHLSTYINERVGPQVSLFSGRTKKVLLSSSAIRPKPGSMGLHRSSQTGKSVVVPASAHVIPIPGQLATPTYVSPASPGVDSPPRKVVFEPRSSDQRSQIRVDPDTKHSVPRRTSRFHQGNRASHTAKTRSSGPSDSRRDYGRRPVVSTCRVTVMSPDSHIVWCLYQDST